jgi:hypothetical protein
MLAFAEGDSGSWIATLSVFHLQRLSELSAQAAQDAQSRPAQQSQATQPSFLSSGRLWGPDTVAETPRMARVMLWRPEQKQRDVKLRLIRPYYAGFAWLPNGRELLIFTAESAPRLALPHDAGTTFPTFNCHRWNIRTGALIPISTPRPDAYAALPSPDGRALLWLCGNYRQTLILTNSRGGRPRIVGENIAMTHQPYWQDAHTLTFIRAGDTAWRSVTDTTTGRVSQRAEQAPPRRVVIDTRTLQMQEFELAASPAFRKRESE